MSGSPPSLPPAGLPVPPPSRLTPPSSPNVGQPRDGWEPVELQLDYWGKQAIGEKGKITLRQAFRALHVQRLPQLGENPGHHLSMNYTTKEKKQKSKSYDYPSILSADSNSMIFIPPSNEARQKEGEGKGKRAKEPDRRRCSAAYLFRKNSQHSIER